VPPERAGKMSLLDASALEKEWKAKLAELDYQERIGQLIDARQVEAKTVEVFTRCRTKLLGVPSKAKTAIPTLTRADLAALDRLIREALEELAIDPEDSAA
jgi:phage terminase Nu1 subunit (DNA packaging protein)